MTGTLGIENFDKKRIVMVKLVESSLFWILNINLLFNSWTYFRIAQPAAQLSKWNKTGLQLVSRPVERILGLFQKSFKKGSLSKTLKTVSRKLLKNNLYFIPGCGCLCEEFSLFDGKKALRDEKNNFYCN